MKIAHGVSSFYTPFGTEELVALHKCGILINRKTTHKSGGGQEVLLKTFQNCLENCMFLLYFLYLCIGKTLTMNTLTASAGVFVMFKPFLTSEPTILILEIDQSYELGKTGPPSGNTGRIRLISSRFCSASISF
jgi:hypothetical protein